MIKTYFTPRFLFAGFVLMMAPLSMNSQYFWDLGVQTGAANYLGEMGGNELTRRDFVSDMKFSQTRTTAGAFARRKINYDFAVKGQLNWLRLSGDDKLSSNPGRNGRNLSFRNDVFELGAELQYQFYQVSNISPMSRNKTKFICYAGLGAMAVYHNPKTFYNGEWVKLRPLQTEGVAYTRVTAAIPATAGFHFTINNQYRIGWNFNWRTTFTDYLDDASTTYVSHPSGTLAAQVANRTDELNVTPEFAANFTPGNKRGDPEHRDSYMSTSIEFSYLLMGHSKISSPNISTHRQHKWLPSKFGGPQRKVRKVIW